MNSTGHRWAAYSATCFGIGHARVAPGTLATLASIPVHFGLELLPLWAHLVALAVVCGIGFWSAQAVADALGEDDPQIVVIDEVAGTLLALWLAGGHGLSFELMAVIAFRALDIFKPWPIGLAETWKPAGVGIMADDLVAGAIAGGVVGFIARSL